MGTGETAGHRQLQTLPSERAIISFIWIEGETELKSPHGHPKSLLALEMSPSFMDLYGTVAVYQRVGCYHSCPL